MVGAPATADAVARARRLPTLKVGLHLVLVDGRPILPPDEVPDLVDARGRFRDDMARAGVAMFFRASVQRQLAAEIEAQFVAFATTGLVLDHVNAHRHFHLHPTIARLIVAIGRRYGLRAVRVPNEPSALLARVDPTTRASAPLWPYTALLRRRVHRAGLKTPDRVFGLAWSGAMTPSRVGALLHHLPDGVTELYTHLATCDRFVGSASGYRYADELAALTAATTQVALAESRARLIAFSDLSPS